jgi:hypothetical protein
VAGSWSGVSIFVVHGASISKTRSNPRSGRFHEFWGHRPVVIHALAAAASGLRSTRAEA